MTDERNDLINALNRFSEKADSLLKTSGTNTARVSINAGGAGIWVATTACVVMLAINVLLIVMFVTQDIKNDRTKEAQDGKISKMQDYLNAIYMQAPHLKPKPEQAEPNE